MQNQLELSFDQSHNSQSQRSEGNEQQAPHLKLRLGQPDQFAALIKLFTEFTDLTHIEISRDGLRIISMDKAHVSMIDLQLVAAAFPLFEFNRPFFFGIRLKTLHIIARNFRRDDQVMLEVNGEETMLVAVQPAGTRVRATNYKLGLVELMGEMLAPPPEQPNPEAQILIPSNLWPQIFRDIRDCGDKVRLSMDQEKLLIHVFASGGDLEANVVIQPVVDRATSKYGVLCSRSVAGRFQYKHFAQFGQAANLPGAGDCLLQLRRDGPLCMQQELDNEGSTLSFYQAPFIEADD